MAKRKKKNRIQVANQGSISGVPQDVLDVQQEETERLRKEEEQKAIREEIQGRGIQDIDPSIFEKKADDKDDSERDPIKSSQPTIIRDEETGKITGIKFPDGRIYSGIGAREVRGFLDDYLKKTDPDKIQTKIIKRKRVIEEDFVFWFNGFI